MKHSYTSYQRGALQFSLAVIIAGAMTVGTFLYNKVESLIKNPAPAPVETTQVQPPTAFVQPSSLPATAPGMTQTPATSTPQVTVPVVIPTTTQATTCTTNAQCFSLQTTNTGSTFTVTTDTQQLCNITASKLLSTLTKVMKETLTIADMKLYACTTTTPTATKPTTVTTTTTKNPVTYDNMDAEGTVGDGQNSIAVSSITATTMTGTITHDSTKQTKPFTLSVNSSISIFGYNFTLTKITTNSNFPGQYVGSMSVVQAS